MQELLPLVMAIIGLLIHNRKLAQRTYVHNQLFLAYALLLSSHFYDILTENPKCPREEIDPLL
jgi:hypothetical protein